MDGWAGRCVARRHLWTWPLAGRRPLQHTGSAGRLAGARRRLDSAAAGDGGAHFTVCFMLVVSELRTGAKSAIYDCFVLFYFLRCTPFTI